MQNKSAMLGVARWCIGHQLTLVASRANADGRWTSLLA
jgi:hypothetical protein